VVQVAVDADAGDAPASVAVLRERAAALAGELGLALQWTLDESESAAAEGLLTVTPGRVELRWQRALGADTQQRLRPIFVDFGALDVTSGPGRRQNQPLAKAVGRSGGGRDRIPGAGALPGAGVLPGARMLPGVLDLTAGLCEDAWLLASWGCRVIAVERCATAFALARDGLRRAAQDERLREIAGRITLTHAQAGAFLADGAWREVLPIDAVYLDPMFPPRVKRALESKAMRVLRRCVGDDEDAAEVARLALQVVPCRRVVVKRPLHGERLLGDIEPVSVQRGKALRWDVYVGRGV
jgi:16S rRNA (guanine1516-N2)-methyltransferase